MSIIVNADDYGLDENHTLAIAEAFEKGLCTQTTAMANCPWFERAFLVADKKGFLDKVGLHFCLTEGCPLSEEMRDCRVFCDEGGQFTADFHHSLKTRLMLPAAAKRAVAAEAVAQIEKYLDCGGKMMHLDSHHHVHTNFSIATTLLPIAKRYGFKTVRMSRTISSKHMSVPKRVYKLLFNAYARRYLSFQADEFTDLKDFRRFSRQIPAEKTVEIMVHPMYVDGKLTDLGDEDFVLPTILGWKSGTEKERRQ